MPLATAEFDSPIRANALARLVVPAGLTFYAGTMAGFNTTSNLVVRADNVANVRAVGRVETTAVAGENLIVSRGAHRYKNSGTSALTAADFGDVCFIEDDTTVCKVGSNSARAGIFIGLQVEDGVTYAWVDHSLNFA
jgi:hypothetical protein